MAELDESLKLGSGDRSAFEPGRPEADALFHLLAHMAASDGTLHPAEQAFLGRLLPDRDQGELVRWVVRLGAKPPQLDEVARVLVDQASRWTALRFAARMAWKDGVLDDGERAFLQALAVALSLPEGAVERALAEMAPNQARFDASRVLEVVRQVHWRAVQLAAGDLVSPDLLAVCPPDAPVICRIGLDRVEVLAFVEEGLIGRFQEGAGLVRWGSIVSTSVGAGLGEALRIHCEEGVSWTLVDSRLAGLNLVLDRLLRPDAQRPHGEPPRVERRERDDDE